MKNPKLILGIVAGLVVAGILTVSRRARESDIAASPAMPQTPQPTMKAAPQIGARGPAASPAATKETAPSEPESTTDPARWSIVPARQVLATVNRKPLRLSDLVALAPEEAERTMTAEQYESRLGRAIEMELTFQAAQAQAIGLSPEQERRLHRMGSDQHARLAQFQQQGISWSSATAAQLEFEKRLTHALMLQQNLVAKYAAVAPSPDVAVQARYDQAWRDLLAQLKASVNISVAYPTL